MEIKRTFIFNEEEIQVMKKMHTLIDNICGEIGDDCIHCPLRPICYDVPKTSISMLLEKFISEKRMTVG